MQTQALSVPGYRGEISQVRLVPEGDATLGAGPDLARMAEGALAYLSRNPDPDHGHDSRFTLLPHRCPPFAPEVTAGLLTGEWQRRYERAPHIDPVAIADTESRNDIATNLMREMSASDTGLAVQEIVHDRLVGYVRDGCGQLGDDLCWAPPFSLFADVDAVPYAMVWTTAMLLHSEADLFRLTGDDTHRGLARRLFEGLRRVASQDTGRAFFPHGVAPFRDGTAVPGAFPGHYPNVISPLVHYWTHCGDAESLAFARAMAEGFVADLQPGHLHKADGHVHGHNHLQMHAIRGVAQLGALTDDWRLLDWASRAYGYSHAASLDSGWAPENQSDADHRTHSETCLVADQLETAAWLARAGQPDLWDRVDRILRNYLVPAQFCVTPEYEEFWRAVNGERSPAELAAGLEGLGELEGGFLGGMSPTDWVVDAPADQPHHGMVPFQGRQVMVEMPGCCPPSGMRALHLAWSNVVVASSEGILVNLALDRDAPAAEVRSGLPRSGRLEVVARTGSDFLLRPPSWTARHQVRAWRGGREVEAHWGGPAFAYVVFPTVAPGEQLSLTFPLVQFVQQLTQRFMEDSDRERARFVDGDTYTFHWSGSTVTAIEPEGRWLPWCTPA